LPRNSPRLSPATSLAHVRERIVACRRCPELRAYCRAVALTGKPEFADDRYWGKPVPSLGSAGARLLIVGLAPAAHGGNRTGRVFTGDSSGAWLSRAMFRAGFATVPHSVRRGDGFAPVDAFINAALRCAPPANKPTPEQLRRCSGHFRAELALLSRLQVVVGLGKIGFDAAIDRLAEFGYALPADGARPRFSHGAEYALGAPPGREPVALIASFHPSRQNTNTGKLTEAMFDAIFRRAQHILKYR
jgi:uracil-DNA glycosylase family 4